MLRRIALVLVLPLAYVGSGTAAAGPSVHHNAISICAIIIHEMTEGKISISHAREISFAIARAANKHFGRVTCGEMWLYMAMAYVESGFQNNIINSYNCRGMFQVHAPSWARKFGLNYSDLLDLETNADIGIQVWKYYLEMYKRVPSALSAYNSDHPWAAKGYARAVLSARTKIKKRYAQLYRAFKSAMMTASLRPTLDAADRADNCPAAGNTTQDRTKWSGDAKFRHIYL